jgi:hypothetical protein
MEFCGTVHRWLILLDNSWQVRHAFGNYRDILREVSYSPMMADMLTYHGSRSTAHVWEHEVKDDVT